MSPDTEEPPGALATEARTTDGPRSSAEAGSGAPIGATADGSPDRRDHLRHDLMLRDLTNAYRYASARQRPAAFYCLAENEPVSTDSVRTLGTSIIDSINSAGGKRIPDLDLVVDSVGGDIHAAYRLVSFLYDTTDHFSTCVPLYARSAATLLCVAADQIVLGELAVLGPLDAQVYEAGRNYRPALTTFKSLERIREFSLETLRAACEAVEGLNMTSSEQAVRYATEFVKVMSASMFSPMESAKIGEYSQALAVGERYGDRLYERRPSREMDRGEWQRTIGHLVNDYPNHEVVIDFAELERLHLPVQRFGEREQPFVRQMAVRHGMKRMVFFLDPRAVSEEEWLASDTVSRLMAEEVRRQVEDGTTPARQRQTVYDVRLVSQFGTPGYRWPGMGAPR